MQLTEIVADSKEYIRVAVCSTKNGAPYDPTSTAVDFAFCDAEDADDPPAFTTWYAGSWETVDGVHYAQLLVNATNGWAPSGASTYAVFVRVSDNPEVPVKYAGLIKVR